MSTGAIAGIWSSITQRSAGASPRFGNAIFAMVPLVNVGVGVGDRFASRTSRAVAVADGLRLVQSRHEFGQVVGLDHRRWHRRAPMVGLFVGAPDAGIPELI